MAKEENKKRECPDKEKEREAKKIASVEEKKNEEASLTIKQLSIKFPSLPLDDTSVSFVGLYFAASWCDDCQAAAPAVNEFASSNSKELKIVYIASDTTEEEMKKFVPSSFATVPFDHQEERSNLKRHFGTCASKERESLGMTEDEKKHGIPTLIIIDATTGKVVTTNGVQDIQNNNDNADSVVEKWKAMLKSESETKN